MKIIIIEDDEDIVESCSLTLRIVWPEIEIVPTKLGIEGIQWIESALPDIVILDIGLPDINGFEVLKNIRLFSSVPILVLTVREEEADIVKALELGADEYIIKPFKHMELVARIKKLIQRRDFSKSKRSVKIGSFSFDPYSNKLYTDKIERRLTNTENKILCILYENSGRVVTFASVANALWDTGYTESNNAIHVYIRRLRKKIETDASHPQLILTKTGIGYYLVKTE